MIMQGGGGHGNANVSIYVFLIKYLVHKLLTIITRILISIIKIPVLPKICLKKLYFVCSLGL